MKKLNECSCGCGGDGGCNDENGNYMFFGNLKLIKKYVDAMLEMDANQVQEILSNGHDWAADHIATSKDDVQEVGDFLMNEMQHGQEIDSYNKKLKLTEETLTLMKSPESIPKCHRYFMKN